MTKENYYYSMNDLESRGATCTAVFGERGNGKSFSAKKKMIDYHKKTGRCVGYIRRHVNELEGVMFDIFNDMKPFYPDDEFELEGSSKTGYCYYLNGKPFCYLFALKTAFKKKGISFPDIDFMFFDEYVPEDMRFLKNEKQMLVSLMSTVFRNRYFRFHLASNSISYVCPLLDMFGIQPRGSKQFYTRKEKNSKGETRMLFALEITQESDYREDMVDSDLGLISKLAGVDEYMFGNKVLLDNDEHINPNKPRGYDMFLCAFKVGTKIYGCWTNDNFDGFYVYEKYEKNNFRNMKYYIFKEDKTEGWLDIKNYRKEGNIKQLKLWYGEGRVQFKNQNIKRCFIEDISGYL